MGPRNAVPRDSRTRVFDAATHEFAERGYEAAGVDRIAASARVNKAMIYYHFGSKLDLYREVLRHMLRAVGERARAIADGPGPAELKLDLWIGTLIAEAAARPWFPPIMLRELASSAEHLDADTVALGNAVFIAVRDIIVQGQQEGTFRDVDPLLIHLTLMPAVLLFFARMRVLKRRPRGTGLLEPRAEEAFVRHMQDVARRMLRKD